MPITFANDNDVIIYALEKIISDARDIQYIFLVQSVWWISSIIGLQQGLAIHIDNLKNQSENIVIIDQERMCQNTPRVSATPRDIQEESRPDIINLQSDNSESGLVSEIIRQTKKFIKVSKRERKAIRIQKELLLHTRSGRITINPNEISSRKLKEQKTQKSKEGKQRASALGVPGLLIREPAIESRTAEDR